MSPINYIYTIKCILVWNLHMRHLWLKTYTWICNTHRHEPILRYVVCISTRNGILTIHSLFKIPVENCVAHTLCTHTPNSWYHIEYVCQQGMCNVGGQNFLSLDRQYVSVNHISLSKIKMRDKQVNGSLAQHWHCLFYPKLQRCRKSNLFTLFILYCHIPTV